MKRELLIEKTNKLSTDDFKTKKEAIAYSVKLNNELHDEEYKLEEEIKELQNKLWEIRSAESKTMNFWHKLVFKQSGKSWKNC